MGPGSREVYTRHARTLVQWMLDMGLPGDVLLILPQQLVECFEHIYLAGYCYATPNAVRSAVADAFNVAFKSPPYPTDHPSVKSALKGYKRAAAGRSRNRQGIQRPYLQQLLERARLRVPPALWLQVEALYRVGYEALLRISESLGLRPENITMVEEAVEIYLCHSKTDQYGKGVSVRVTCPRLRELLHTLKATTPMGQPIFTVSADYVNAIISEVAQEAQWSGFYSYHSLRHGRATDLWITTRDIHRVMLAGRWSTRAAARWYIHTIPT